MPKAVGHPSVVKQMILCSLLHVRRTSASINREVALLELDGSCGATTVASTLSQLVKEGLIEPLKLNDGTTKVEYGLTREGKNKCKALLTSYQNLLDRGRSELKRRIERDSVASEPDLVEDDSKPSVLDWYIQSEAPFSVVVCYDNGEIQTLEGSSARKFVDYMS